MVLMCLNMLILILHLQCMMMLCRLFCLLIAEDCILYGGIRIVLLLIVLILGRVIECSGCCFSGLSSLEGRFSIRRLRNLSLDGYLVVNISLILTDQIL